MSPFCQDTDSDHAGGVGVDVIEDQFGVPERLWGNNNVSEVLWTGYLGMCIIPNRGDLPAPVGGRFADSTS